MNTNPLISIIVPVYNSCEYLKRCIVSCLSQSYANIEVIAVNDGSTDESLDVLTTLELNDSRLIIINQTNKGVVAARCSGIAKAKGEWIVFVDSDDYMPSNAVENLFDKSHEGDYDIVIGQMKRDFAGKIINCRQTDVNNLSSKEDFACANLSGAIGTSLSAKIYRSTLFNSVVFDAELTHNEDLYANIQLFNNSNKIASVDSCVYYYFNNELSVSKFRNKQMIDSLLKVLNLTEKYYSKQEYSESKRLKKHSYLFIIRKYYELLLSSNGAYYDRNKINDICNVYLKDPWINENVPINIRFTIKLLKLSKQSYFAGRLVVRAIDLAKSLRLYFKLNIMSIL